MIRKTLFMLFLLAALSFASWEGVAGLAITTSLMLIIITFMIGHGFGVDVLKMTAKDEFYQLIALAFMIVIFFGTNNIIDAVSTAPELAGAQANMQTTALLSLNESIKDISIAYSAVQSVDKEIGIAAAEGLSCNLQSMGYFVSGCGGFSMLATPFSLAGSIMGFALGELNAIYRLIDLALNYALPLLLPLGIILRTFRITRGAGGFLIAAGLSMHILLPVGILFVDILGDAFLEDEDTPAEYKASATLSNINECDVSDSFSSGCLGCRPGDTGDLNSDRAIYTYNTLRASMKNFMFLVLIKATLGPIVAVLMMVSGIRFMSALAGAEVDVSALARVI